MLQARVTSTTCWSRRWPRRTRTPTWSWTSCTRCCERIRHASDLCKLIKIQLTLWCVICYCSGSGSSAILQEYGTGRSVAGLCRETDGDDPEHHWVRQADTRFYASQPGRSGTYSPHLCYYFHMHSSNQWHSTRFFCWRPAHSSWPSCECRAWWTCPQTPCCTVMWCSHKKPFTRPTIPKWNWSRASLRLSEVLLNLS